MKLSYTAVSKYRECPYKYKLHYIDKIRPDYTGSALIFGSVLGEAVECFLNDFKEQTVDYKEIFEKRFRGLSKDKIKYSKSDLDERLIEHLNSDLSIEEKSRESLIEKGLLLLDVFANWANENIVEVHGTEIEVKLTNEDGDSFVGFLDFDVTMKDGVRRIMDLKTSSSPKRYYPDSSAEESMQLTIYSHDKQNPEVGYIILDKNIRVREPRARFREVYGKITEEQEANVFNEIDEVLHNIKDEIFPKNLDSCFNFGGCPYKNFCKHGSMKDLVKKE